MGLGFYNDADLLLAPRVVLSVLMGRQLLKNTMAA
jgi:hypothetical protein